MNKLTYLTLGALLVASVNPAYAQPSWLDSIFGSKTSEEAKDKSRNGDKKVKEKVNKEKKDKGAKRNGPPDHAKAHGYRAKFKHYPDANVYENTETGTFYEKNGGTWRPLENMPTKVDLGNGITVDLESAIPQAIQTMSE